MLKVIVNDIILTIFFVLVILITICLSPIRWDIKSLSPSVPSLDEPFETLPDGALFVSTDNQGENARIARYGMDFLFPPDTKNYWLVFKEGFNSTWSPEYLVDRDGVFFRRQIGGGWESADETPPVIKKFFESGIILTPSAVVSSALKKRLPIAESADIRFVSLKSRSFIESPTIRFSLKHIFRLFLMIVVIVIFSRLLSVFAAAHQEQALQFFNGFLGIPIWVAVHCSSVYVLGKVIPATYSVAFLLELFTGITLMFVLRSKFDRHSSVKGFRHYLKYQYWLITLACIAGISILRLDFDGDLFTHWLPLTRHFYWIGGHEPAELLSRFGLAHESTYPPGFAILIATFMWVSDMPRELSFQYGIQSNMAVYLYRTFFAIFHIGFLSCVSALIGANSKSLSKNGIIWAGLSLAFLFPLFLGEPLAAEIFLVPFTGFAAISFIYAARHQVDKSFFMIIGVSLTLFLLFIKNDSMLFMPVLVLLLLRARPKASEFKIWQWLLPVLSLAPWIIWRVEISSLGYSLNFMFNPVKVSELITKLPEVKLLLIEALKVLIKSNYLYLFILFVVSYVIKFRNEKISGLLVVASIIGLVFYLPLIYVFTKSDPVTHLMTSYQRLVATPTLIASLLTIHWLSNNEF